jgi:hypothetical protein
VYQPGTGTWLTPDSHRAGGSAADLSVGVDPLTANRYSYVNGDPLNRIDPSGHRFELYGGGASRAEIRAAEQRREAAAEMRDYLDAHGALPGNWNSSPFALQAEYYQWAVLANGGRYSGSYEKWQSVSTARQYSLWDKSGSEALHRLADRDCETARSAFVCRNKKSLTTLVVAGAVGALTGGAGGVVAAGLLGEASGLAAGIAAGAISGGAGAAGASATAQLLTTGHISVGQLARDTAIGIVTGGLAGAATHTLATRAAAASAGAAETSSAASGPLELANPITVNNAASPIRSFATAQDQTYYRVFSGTNTDGAFLTGAPPAGSQAAIEGLALPPGNTAEFLQEVHVPAGTMLQSSITGPAFGQPGGMLQFQLLERLDPKFYGPGVPFL